MRSAWHRLLCSDAKSSSDVEWSLVLTPISLATSNSAFTVRRTTKLVLRGRSTFVRTTTNLSSFCRVVASILMFGTCSIRPKTFYTDTMLVSGLRSTNFAQNSTSYWRKPGLNGDKHHVELMVSEWRSTLSTVAARWGRSGPR